MDFAVYQYKNALLKVLLICCVTQSQDELSFFPSHFTVAFTTFNNFINRTDKYFTGFDYCFILLKVFAIQIHEFCKQLHNMMQKPNGRFCEYERETRSSLEFLNMWGSVVNLTGKFIRICGLLVKFDGKATFLQKQNFNKMTSRSHAESNCRAFMTQSDVST